MIHKIMNINSLTEEMIAKYFPMLTELRQKKISLMGNFDDRRIALCSEILARQCLSQLCDAPEFAFELLCNPNGKSVVGNFNAKLCIVKSGNVVGCAVSQVNIGMGLVELIPFSFYSAQNIFTDTEIRCIFSESKYSFAELIKMSECTEKTVINKYAVMKSLKDAHFYASGRGIRSEVKNITFEISDNKILCSDAESEIRCSFIEQNNNVAVSVIERSK